jgi:hypothetical protein
MFRQTPWTAVAKSWYFVELSSKLGSYSGVQGESSQLREIKIKSPVDKTLAKGEGGGGGNRISL